MKVFAIGDLHLSHQVEKPMDIFGDNWENHLDKLTENWERSISGTDVVIMPGDFSWATYLDQAKEDFLFLERLPGKKILLKGNHDYWWETVTKMNRFLSSIDVKTVDFLYNNSHSFDGKVFCGTKGYDALNEKDSTIINRETMRFENSLESCKRRSGEVIAVFHYPPDKNPVMVSLMKKHGIKKCIYGHIHGSSEWPVSYLDDGIEYLNVSADRICFQPVRI